MRVVIEGHEIVEAQISKVSLVKRAASRVPFKIVKSAGAPPTNEPLPNAGNPTVIPHKQPDNGEVATGRRVDDRYPLGRPVNPLRLRKDHSLDALVRHATRNKSGGGW